MLQLYCTEPNGQRSAWPWRHLYTPRKESLNALKWYIHRLCVWIYRRYLPFVYACVRMGVYFSPEWWRWLKTFAIKTKSFFFSVSVSFHTSNHTDSAYWPSRACRNENHIKEIRNRYDTIVVHWIFSRSLLVTKFDHELTCTIYFYPIAKGDFFL